MTESSFEISFVAHNESLFEYPVSASLVYEKKTRNRSEPADCSRRMRGASVTQWIQIKMGCDDCLSSAPCHGAMSHLCILFASGSSIRKVSCLDVDVVCLYVFAIEEHMILHRTHFSQFDGVKCHLRCVQQEKGISGPLRWCRCMCADNRKIGSQETHCTTK